MMRKLILKMSVTIDGFVAGKNGELGWMFRTRSEESTQWVLDVVCQAGAHLMGSRTFNDMKAYWPTSTDVFAAPMNAVPKIVFSRSGLPTPEQTTRALIDANAQNDEKGTPNPTAAQALESWQNAAILTGNLSEEINRLKQQPGKPLLAHGGAAFAQSLVKLNLIDEYYLMVHPVVLGEGMPLFPQLPEPFDLKLVDVKLFKSGAAAHIYRPG